MPIPDFQSLMLPALNALSGGRQAPVSEVRERIAIAEGLALGDMQEMLPSGRQSVFANRVSWAVKYLERAGLTERVRRGVWRLTAEGQSLLTEPPSRIDMNYLRKYPAFVEWRTGRNAASSDDDAGRNLAAALIAAQSCAEASRMPERVAGLLGLLRRSGDEALGEELRESVSSKRALSTRFVVPLDHFEHRNYLM